MAENNEGEVDVKPEEEMTPEELTKLKEDEDFILGFKEEDKQDDAKVERLDEALKNARTTIHQKYHYRDKLKEITDGKPPKAPEKPATPPKKKESDVEGTISATDVLNFRFDHNDIPKTVVDEIVSYAEYKKIPLEDALKTKVVQKMVQEAKRTDDVEDGTPPPSRRTGGQVVGDRDWSNATPAEMDAARNRIMYPKG